MEWGAQSPMELVECYFLRLPPEVLENIFHQPVLQATDLGHLACTCSTIHHVLNSSELWKRKFQQRWPELYTQLEHDLQYHHSGSPTQFKDLFYQRTVTRTSVLHKLEVLAEQTHTGQDKSLKAVSEGKFFNFLDNECFPEEASTAQGQKYRLEFVISELMDILGPQASRHSLNQRYHADKSLWYLRHLTLQGQVETLANWRLDDSEDSDLDIELAVTLLSQWFQPGTTVTLEWVQCEFDKLVQLVREQLNQISPNHPLFSVESSCGPHLTHSLWSPGQCRQVVDAIKLIFKPSFNKDFREYYNTANSFINKVLENRRGIPITLCITVQAVAKRLGVVLEPVNFPRTFLLRWKEHALSRSGIHQYTFVDPFNGNYHMAFSELGPTLSSHQELMNISEEHCKPCTSQQVIERMLRNLIGLGKQSNSDTGLCLMRHAAEFYCTLAPAEVEMAILNVQLKLHLKVNLLSAISTIEDIRSLRPTLCGLLADIQDDCERTLERMRTAEPRLKPPKYRAANPEVQYAAGMVMKHRKYKYLCVIHGWDSRCEASMDWIVRMGVSRAMAQQPFYKVFVEDGSDRYACQENLTFTTEVKEIPHPEVGRLFENFTGQYYVATRMLQEVYPDDQGVTHDLITQFLQQHSSESESL